MATTTNYGWTTPDDTALVKDGASAIRTLGSSVDTTTKALNPSTTLGDVEYRSSTANTNTRLGIGSSGQALTVVAGVPSWAASPTSVLTTTGDTLYASAANTLARLGIGTTGQVLTVAGGVPTWAAAASGSYTQLATGTLSGTTTTISSISGSYRHLYLRIVGAQIATVSPMAFTLNGDGGTNYQVKRGATDSTTFQNATATQFQPTGENIPTTANSITDTLLIENYSITGYKALTYRQGLSNKGFMGFGAYYGSTSAITSIGITSQSASANLSVGTYTLWGIN